MAPSGISATTLIPRSGGHSAPGPAGKHLRCLIKTRACDERLVAKSLNAAAPEKVMRWNKLHGPLILIGIATGCGGNTAIVSGKVTYQGRPVTSGSVIVLNQDGTAESWVILPDGTYSVPGVKRGHVKFG